MRTAAHDLTHDYPVDLPTGGTDVFGRTGDTWQRAIDDWTRWLQAARKRPRTVYQRRWQLRRLAEAYPRKSPWKLDLDDLTRWLTSSDAAPETTKSASSALRSFYRWGLDTGRTKRNPAAKLPSVKVGRHLPRPASDVLVARVVAETDPRTRLMVMLAYWAGLRASEIAGLRWDHIETAPPVDTSGGTARVGPQGGEQSTRGWGQIHVLGKGDRERIVPLHMQLRAELEAWRDGGAQRYRYHHDADVWVFPGQTPGGLHPHRVSSALSRALGPGVVGHQLRHGFATRVLEATGDLAATQDLLGHASPATTRIYARTSTRALRAAIDKL